VTPCPISPRDLITPHAALACSDELAAYSWNLQVLLASLSSCSGDGSSCTWSGNPTAFDPDDPFSTAPGQCSWAQPQFCSTIGSLLVPGNFDPGRPFSTSPGQCSWAQPQFCSTVDSVLGLSTASLADDPDAPPLERWIWESGAEYTVAVATGAFDGFAGGIAHLADPERSRAAGWRVGVPIVLLPPGPEDPAPLLLYAVAPEPGDGSLCAAALAVLAAAAWRGRSRRPARV
jgi:hypothetical protein